VGTAKGEGTPSSKEYQPGGRALRHCHDGKSQGRQGEGVKRCVEGGAGVGRRAV